MPVKSGNASIRDRTQEFLGIAQRVKKSRSSQNGPSSSGSKLEEPRSAVAVQSEFNRRASKIGLGIHQTSQKLYKLAKYGNKQMFVAGKSQLFINSYAKALEVIPRQLCDNAGFDATDVLNKLRQKHALPSGEGGPYGVDINTGGITDSFANFVWEPAVVKINAINAATEAACLILSVDETVKNPKSESAQGDAAASAMGGRR